MGTGRLGVGQAVAGASRSLEGAISQGPILYHLTFSPGAFISPRLHKQCACGIVTTS